MAGQSLAQGGDCFLTLLSDESTTHQEWCSTILEEDLVPIVYLIEGTGLSVTGLPPGVGYSVVADTLTLSGTVSGVTCGVIDIAMNEGCIVHAYYQLSERVDPQFACSVEGDSVTVSWPGMDTPNDNAVCSGNINVIWATLEEPVESGSFMLFTPCPQSWTLGGLPQGVPITFLMWHLYDQYGMQCIVGMEEATCTIQPTGMDEFGVDGSMMRVVLNGDQLELSASHALKEVWIHSAIGQLMAARTLNTNTASIPIASLAAGAYVLHVQDSEGRMAVQRFVRADP